MSVKSAISVISQTLSGFLTGQAEALCAGPSPLLFPNSGSLSHCVAASRHCRVGASGVQCGRPQTTASPGAYASPAPWRGVAPSTGRHTHPGRTWQRNTSSARSSARRPLGRPRLPPEGSTSPKSPSQAQRPAARLEPRDPPALQPRDPGARSAPLAGLGFTASGCRPSAAAAFAPGRRRRHPERPAPPAGRAQHCTGRPLSGAGPPAQLPARWLCTRNAKQYAGSSALLPYARLWGEVHVSWAWWATPVIPEVWRLRQEDDDAGCW
ncbi:PREDICTED: translation initiation factor IF-2-like [Chinchilla lanigera]|uniref:translation initiation factor IF-2-like n=1 Tax=Chinchilla lanigera TaxID=34839 RepID=UPI0006969CC5|nr:PREDICTED: translation initiation factor IF-2-like [Chinchilla lanigera]